MPHMIAGVGGPAEEHLAQNREAAPPHGAGGHRQRAAAADGDELDDGHDPDGLVFEATEEVLPDPVVPDVVTSAKYRRLFGTLPLHMAVLDVFCRMAALGGRLMGDNMADTVQMTEQQMRDLADEAQNFIIEYVDVLFGPAHTTKAHRLASHLLAALLRNGNLWEGDTSENERLHGPCKKMYGRTNKRGPTVVLQMMRAAETQCEVLRELRELEDEDGDGLFDLLEQPDGAVDVETVPNATMSQSHRGLRMTIGQASRLPGMTALDALLQMQAECSLVVSQSFTFFCTFEWGASSVVQTACAAESYLGNPRYDYIWYTDQDGRRKLGWARLIVRMLGGAVDDFVVVRCLEDCPAIPLCSLTRSGCKRMAWRFAHPNDDWPEIARVPLTKVLRIEHVVADFQDLGNRLGLRAVPSSIPATAAERHAQRFFTNHFHPFTSRVLNPSS